LRAENGQIDADLGGGVIKQRIARPGEGKSNGYRSIILFRKGEQFKNMAKHVFALTDVKLVELIANGQFEEVVEDDQEIPQ
jgi:hypothetical protein